MMHCKSLEFFIKKSLYIINTALYYMDTPCSLIVMESINNMYSENNHCSINGCFFTHKLIVHAYIESKENSKASW